MVSTDIDVKTLVGRPVAFTAQVPFSSEEGLVVMLLECLSDRHLLVCKIIAILWVQHQVGGAVALAGNPVSNIHANGVPTGHDGTTRGRTRRAHKKPCEARAGVIKLIEIRRANPWMTVPANGAVALIIGDN